MFEKLFFNQKEAKFVIGNYATINRFASVLEQFYHYIFQKLDSKTVFFLWLHSIHWCHALLQFNMLYCTNCKKDFIYPVQFSTAILMQRDFMTKSSPTTTRQEVTSIFRAGHATTRQRQRDISLTCKHEVVITSSIWQQCCERQFVGLKHCPIAVTAVANAQ